MGLSGDGFHGHCACGAPIGPCDGEGDEQAVELLGGPEAGVPEVESARLGIGEQAFDAPAPAIEVEGLLCLLPVCGNDPPTPSGSLDYAVLLDGLPLS